jgi:DNA-binding IclR family transcriptional regulator
MVGIPDEEAERRYRAPALDKGLDILEKLAATEGGLTQIELAKSLSRTPNELYRMLDRLVRRGYVLRSGSDRYVLGLKLFALAHQHPPMQRLVSQAQPVLRRFAKDAGQACHLAIYERGRVVVVAQEDAPGYWALALRVGAQLDLLNSASGRVLLAFQAAQERAHMLAEYAAAVGAGGPPAELESQLARIRARGHEVLASRERRGVTVLSAPVLGADGAAIAVVSCPYVPPVDGAAEEEAIAALLVRASESLSLSPRNARSASSATASPAPA